MVSNLEWLSFEKDVVAVKSSRYPTPWVSGEFIYSKITFGPKQIERVVCYFGKNLAEASYSMIVRFLNICDPEGRYPGDIEIRYIKPTPKSATNNLRFPSEFIDFLIKKIGEKEPLKVGDMKRQLVKSTLDGDKISRKLLSQLKV
jgi:hypothetical protein